MTRVILIAISDLVADQRVNRAAIALHNAGYEVIAIGRRLPKTPRHFSCAYRVKLLKIPFNKGFLFYALFNLYAFFYLLFSRFALVQANDLDTLLASRLACFCRRKPLIYDSHELFTEVPELINRPFVKNLWERLEKKLAPSLKYCTTVSQSVADELHKRHGIIFHVIRNLPIMKGKYIDYQVNDNIIIYQGALNIGRGLEKLIEAMQHINDAKLVIAGTGDIDDKLMELTSTLNLEQRITFLGRVPLGELHGVTCTATLGVSLEEDMGLNYRYALPNKLFDYIQAGIPVLTSNFPEMAAIVKNYGVGDTIESSCNPKMLAEKFNQILNDKSKLLEWNKNAMVAAGELCWENETGKFIEIVEKALIHGKPNVIRKPIF